MACKPACRPCCCGAALRAQQRRPVYARKESALFDNSRSLPTRAQPTKGHSKLHRRTTRDRPARNPTETDYPAAHSKLSELAAAALRGRDQGDTPAEADLARALDALDKVDALATRRRVVRDPHRRLELCVRAGEREPSLQERQRETEARRRARTSSPGLTGEVKRALMYLRRRPSPLATLRTTARAP